MKRKLFGLNVAKKRGKFDITIEGLYSFFETNIFRTHSNNVLPYNIIFQQIMCEDLKLIFYDFESDDKLSKIKKDSISLDGISLLFEDCEFINFQNMKLNVYAIDAQIMDYGKIFDLLSDNHAFLVTNLNSFVLLNDRVRNKTAEKEHICDGNDYDSFLKENEFVLLPGHDAVYLKIITENKELVKKMKMTIKSLNNLVEATTWYKNNKNDIIWDEWLGQNMGFFRNKNVKR